MLRWVEMAICLLPVMTLMWLFTTVCILVTIPNLSLVSGTYLDRLKFSALLTSGMPV